MSLKNIALQQLGAQIIDKSSATNDNLHPPINVLLNQEDLIWNSAEGLPQYLTISLQNLHLQYESISQLGFHCWHDYQSNPKIIQIQVASTKQERFIFWTTLTLKQQSGKQFFRIKPIPSSYKIIKFLITQTFGQFQTYLNQIFILVNTDSDHSHQNESLNIQDLQQPKQTYYNEQSQNSDIKVTNKFDKLKKEELHTKKPIFTKSKEKYNYYEDKESNREQSEVYQHDIYKKNFSKQYEQKDMHNGSEEQYQQQQNEEQEMQQDDKSLNKDLALLALSKNVMEMQENIQNIKRELEVLNLKINMSFQKFQNKFIAKVEHIVDDKIKKIKHQLKYQLKNQLRKQQEQNEYNPKIKSKRQNTYKSKESIQYQQKEQQYQIIPHKKDKGFTKNQNKQINKPQLEKQTHLASLMNKLAKKLQQRQIKMKKIQIKRSKQQLSKRHTIHQM